MYPLTIPFAANTPGTNTLELLFQQLAGQYPQFTISPATHVIRRVQHFSMPYRPERSIVIVGSLVDPKIELRFVYDRYRVSRYLNNPLFNETEIPQVQDMDASQLAQYLTQKFNLNFHGQDFLIELAGITYTGGTLRPNWRLQARPESPFWYDDKIIWLHSGESEEPEPPDL